MKKPIAVDLEPYIKPFKEQMGKQLISAEHDKTLRLMFQKGRSKTFICPDEILTGITPWNKDKRLSTSDSIMFSLVNEIPDTQLTLSDTVNRIVDGVSVYTPNNGNPRLTVVITLVVPVQKDENGNTIKPKKSDTPIYLLLTVTFPPNNYEF